MMMADDELPPPRGVRWELSEEQYSCLRVPGGAQQREYPLSTTRRRAENQPLNLTKHWLLHKTLNIDVLGI